jgi:ribosomal protein L11 methyltransferase
VRKVSLTIGSQDLEDVLDRLLPIVPQGVHELPSAEGLVLAVYGDEPPLALLEEAVGPALTGVSEAPVDDDPIARRLAEPSRPPIGGRIPVRAEGAPPAPAGLLDIVIGGGGGVFGAGTHPTTEMCLELLLSLPPVGSLADVGCGTGVLAIAAAMLGWEPVFALDHEPLAVEAAAANARRNGVAVEALQADLLEVPPPPVKAIVANVPPKVHERIAGHLPGDVDALIVSGVDHERLGEVVGHYAGFSLADSLERGSWTATLLVRDD